MDYTWDLYKDKIVLDPELDVKSLGWMTGDYFRVVKTESGLALVKLDELEQFVRGYN